MPKIDVAAVPQRKGTGYPPQFNAPCADRVRQRLGNAGGVTITLNGKPVGPVGPKGQVRTVQFTSGGFEIVAVPKPAAPLDPL